MKIKKILLLWSPLADYTVACLKALSENKDVELYMIYQGGESDAPYDNFDLSFCKKALVYANDKKKELYDFSVNLNPEVILMSSWNYSFYMSISKKCKKNGTYVVSTFDGQYTGTWRQRAGIAISPVFLKPAIDNFFVPGDRQATFARKLGYKNPFFGYYSANSDRFEINKEYKKIKKFIFVGRLVAVKGIEYLMSAYKKYRNSVKDPWDLIICGKGALNHLCENQEGVTVHGFTQPSQLPSRFTEAGCFLLPSVYEPWGLVVHEAALAGLPIIASYASGATTFYVRDGQNGYIINPDEQSLLRAMKLISESSEEKLTEMSAVSRALGLLWTTTKWADYVYRYICLREDCIKARHGETGVTT